MNAPSEPNLVKVTEIFLVPSSFLVAALGTSDTNPHRAVISVLGLVISILWWECCREAMLELQAEAASKRRTRILAWLSWIFIAGWLLSTVAHFALWSRPLGG